MVSMLIFESRLDESTILTFLHGLALPLGMTNPTIFFVVLLPDGRVLSGGWYASVVFMAHAGSFICSTGRSTEPRLMHKSG